MDLHGFPVFTGSNLESWIEWLEDYFVFHHFTEDEKLNLSQALMEGDAYEWLHRRESFQSWNEMKRELWFRFESPPRMVLSPQHMEDIQRNLVSLLQESLATLITQVARIVDNVGTNQETILKEKMPTVEEPPTPKISLPTSMTQLTEETTKGDATGIVTLEQRVHEPLMETPLLHQITSIPETSEVTLCKPTCVLLDTVENQVEHSVVTNTLEPRNAHQVFEVMPVISNKQKRVKVLSDKQRKRVKLSAWFKKIKVKIKFETIGNANRELPVDKSEQARSHGEVTISSSQKDVEAGSLSSLQQPKPGFVSGLPNSSTLSASSVETAPVATTEIGRGELLNESISVEDQTCKVEPPHILTEDRKQTMADSLLSDPGPPSSRFAPEIETLAAKVNSSLSATNRVRKQLMEVSHTSDAQTSDSVDTNVDKSTVDSSHASSDISGSSSQEKDLKCDERTVSDKHDERLVIYDEKPETISGVLEKAQNEERGAPDVCPDSEK